MIEAKYRKAYDNIKPSEGLLNDTILEALCAGAQKKARGARLAVTAAAAALCLFLSLPAAAAHIPGFYRIIEAISPRLADSLVPVERSSTRKGVTMEVEAISIDGAAAEIMISFRDEEGSGQDLIHGKVEVLSGFWLEDYSGESNVGGCSFLGYDEESGKAYFKVDVSKVSVQEGEAFHGDKLVFTLDEIFCEISDEERSIDLTECLESAATKSAAISGVGISNGAGDLPESMQRQPGDAEDPRPLYRVMDLADAGNCAADDFTVTGTAYMDGVLRLQICLGDTQHANRYVQPFLVDAAGNERHQDYSVGWSEKVGDYRYHFEEYWFVGGIGNLEEYSMYGIFHNSGESIKGDWSVTFRLQ